MGCRLWGRTELDTTEATQQQQQQHYIHEALYVVDLNGLSCSVVVV